MYYFFQAIHRHKNSPSNPRLDLIYCASWALNRNKCKAYASEDRRRIAITIDTPGWPHEPFQYEFARLEHHWLRLRTRAGADSYTGVSHYF